MIIRDLFRSDVTRDIPPVVNFHEQSPEKLADEVSEYIITGGWPEGHPNRTRVPRGIHEEYVRLLTNIASELDKPGGSDLPTAWVSGFYGSGKSSFAKLLGLALDGVALPDGRSLAEAWLDRDTSAKKNELREAWQNLRSKIEPMAVVFDLGGVARDNEHVHAAALRQVQKRLGYCSTDPMVADFELRLERDGEWQRFEETAGEVLGQPWSEALSESFADDKFSQVLSHLYPDRYPDPTSWIMSRGGTHVRSESPKEAVEAIRDMLRFRRPEATLFLVVDEVSQYVLSNKDRADRLRAFAMALGTTLKGKAWLVALGQQKLDEEADDAFLVWAKDRFPPKFRVHLSATNIRDVVHKRLLEKTDAAKAQLRELFEAHRPQLKLYAYGCEQVSAEDFAEVYPMLPGQIDLILQLTSALRTRSSRSQGDDQAIRGLLQLLGELFRDQDLAELDVGHLVTLDQIYEVQHTALDSDVQASMARVLTQCSAEEDRLLLRAAKAVALLELIQDTVPTDVRLVAQSLYSRVDLGNHVAEVEEALQELRRRNLLGYSEKQGYKIQSSAAEEWERDRRDISVSKEAKSEVVADALEYLLAQPDQPRLEGRPFPWAAVFSDGGRADDQAIKEVRDAATVDVDFRLVGQGERDPGEWIRRSSESAFENRLVWVVGDTTEIEDAARELFRSRVMVMKFKPRRESMSAKRKQLLLEEESRVEELQVKARDAVAAAWMSGQMYFRGLPLVPAEQGASFSLALHSAASQILPDLYPHFLATQIVPSELMQLIETDLTGPSPKFLEAELGILELDGGRYVAACSGTVPRRIQEFIEAEGGVGCTTLLARFGGPPFGYTANVIKACVAGLLRAGKIKIQPEAGSEINAFRDAGVREVFQSDRSFKRSTVFPAGEDDVGPQARARICRLFDPHLEHPLDREDHAIADAAARLFPAWAKQLRSVQTRLDQLPEPKEPEALRRLGEALEASSARIRETKPTVLAIKKHLDALRDGVQQLKLYDSELTEAAIQQVRQAHDVQEYQASQLLELSLATTEVDAAAQRVREQLRSEKPWRDIRGLDADLETIREAYESERRQILQWQEEETEAARGRIRRREGFSTLTSEQSHGVLRPVAQAGTSTTADAVAPPLSDLRDKFRLHLERAEVEANELLDEILSQGEKPMIQKMDLKLKNRELRTEADVDKLLAELRERLLEGIRDGRHIRLL